MCFTSGAARLPALLRRPGERGGRCSVLRGLRGSCLERESVMPLPASRCVGEAVGISSQLVLCSEVISRGTSVASFCTVLPLTWAMTLAALHVYAVLRADVMKANIGWQLMASSQPRRLTACKKRWLHNSVATLHSQARGWQPRVERLSFLASMAQRVVGNTATLQALMELDEEPVPSWGLSYNRPWDSTRWSMRSKRWMQTSALMCSSAGLAWSSANAATYWKDDISISAACL